jgi:prevent-host-death family protein
MTYTDAIEPVTVLKSRSAEMIRRAKRTGRPVVITQNGRPTAVLQDVESFDRQRSALLLLLALASGERDYQAGRTVSNRTADRRFRQQLARLGRG